MPTSNPAPTLAPEQRLTQIFAQLDTAQQHTLLAFAEFLAAGGAPAPVPAACPAPAPDQAPGQAQSWPRIQEPAALPRPERETVIAAIRRLGLTYAMLDREPMLHETAALMSAHVLHGRTAAAVIDDLEALFRRRYQDYRTHQGRAPEEPEADAPGGD
ncbi:hypothetical protein [uncultured Thiodictyon sp.]|jgi:hypothetical protein|uniref:hypothetical protein n=1 Tax=uncultured Thiodictyon sp. TaxID=1846217 RepID=UPI0025E01EE3|nr:hypothetical protein [uncultured Thiodictyon sp.]